MSLGEFGALLPTGAGTGDRVAKDPEVIGREDVDAEGNSILLLDTIAFVLEIAAPSRKGSDQNCGSQICVFLKDPPPMLPLLPTVKFLSELSVFPADPKVPYSGLSSPPDDGGVNSVVLLPRRQCSWISFPIICESYVVGSSSSCTIVIPASLANSVTDKSSECSIYIPPVPAVEEVAAVVPPTGRER